MDSDDFLPNDPGSLLDSEPALNVYPGISSDNEPVLHDDPRMNMDFPILPSESIYLSNLSTYQIKQAKSYYGEHIRNDGSYAIEVCIDRASDLLQGFPSVENCTLLRGKIQSRHIGRKIYFVYILYEDHNQGIQAIKHYCCNCIVGRRTVGCCAHIMSVIWYLSWARYENVTPPAQFLDHVLLTYENE